MIVAGLFTFFELVVFSVEFRHEAFKQDGTLVAACTRQAFMHRRPA